MLLIQLQDDLARSRLREAFWISIILHMVVVISIVAAPKLLPPRRAVVLQSAEDLMRQKELTFLELPPDAQKATRRPETNIVSDKDRIATSRTPTIDRETLQKLRDWRRAGAPGPGGQPSPPAPGLAQANPAQSPERSPGGSPPPPEQVARLEAPPQSRGRQPFGGGAMSPGSAIEQAARASAASRGGVGGAGGEYGLGPGRTQGTVHSDMDILSDTMGVDFGPYLARVLAAVRMNWYSLIPEVARAPLMKRGKVSIEFAILKDGQVAGMRLTGPSGDVSLDRAAWGGITASNPFPPLPSEFRGSYLALRFHFFYNPDKSDLQ